VPVVILLVESGCYGTETDDNLMQYIKTEVKNGTLILGFTDEVKNKSIRPSERIVFNQSLEEVASLDLTAENQTVYAPSTARAGAAPAPDSSG